MKLIFIRHGDPDYSIDSLTEKGWREAELLSERVKTWDNITDFYVSPLGRAQDTANVSLKKMDRTAKTLDWLKEFWVPTKNPNTGKITVPWDFYPEYWTNDKMFMDQETCFKAQVYENTDVGEQALNVTENFDRLLSEYGYDRKGKMYFTQNKDDENTLVFFCHLGVSFLIIGHLINIAPTVLWESFFTPPTGVTVLVSEERDPGKVQFRVQTWGDTLHLHDGKEPISSSGLFTDAFQK